jgi:hypothetical protein
MTRAPALPARLLPARIASRLRACCSRWSAPRLKVIAGSAIVNVALPDTQHDLHLSQSGLKCGYASAPFQRGG